MSLLNGQEYPRKVKRASESFVQRKPKLQSLAEKRTSLGFSCVCCFGLGPWSSIKPSTPRAACAEIVLFEAKARGAAVAEDGSVVGGDCQALRPGLLQRHRVVLHRQSPLKSLGQRVLAAPQTEPMRSSHRPQMSFVAL